MNTGPQSFSSLRRLSPRQLALLVFGAALLLRFAFAAGFQTWHFIDRWQFGQEIGRIGRFLVELGDFVVDPGQPTSKFPPLYPFIVALVFRFGGVYTTLSAVALILFQSVCAGLAAVCLMVLGSRLFSRTAGIVAGFGWACYPSSLFESTAVIWYSELSILLVLLMLVVATSPAKAATGRFAMLGVLAGVLILTDSSMLVYVVLVAGWALVSLWNTDRRAIMTAVVVWIAVVVALLTPWAIRNVKVVGSPNVLKSNFGMELFYGNNPYSSSGTLDSERRQAIAALPQDQLAQAKNGSESEYFAFLRREAVKWIRDNPGRFLKLTAIRFWNFWGKFPSDGPDRWRHYSWFHIIWYFPVLLLSMLGIRDRFRRQSPVVLIVLFLLVYPLPYYLTHVQLYRYRYPVEPFLVLLAAAPLGAVLESRQRAGRLREG